MSDDVSARTVAPAGNGAPAEFSRPLAVGRALRGIEDYRIVANPAEREALARRFGFLSIERLEAVFTIVPGRDGALRLTQTLSAAVTQACVVTLDPVPEAVDDVSQVEFRAGLDEEEADRLTFEAEDDLVVEPLPPVSIDLGELAAQQLAVAADPFPRSAAVREAADGA